MWVHDKFETLSLPPGADNDVPLVSAVRAACSTHGVRIKRAPQHTCITLMHYHRR